MTVQFCVELCRAKRSLHVTALQGDKCICIENSILQSDFSKLPETFCNEKCSGNPLQRCGDANGYFSVFDTAKYNPHKVSECIDYLKLGMIPMSDQCVTLMFEDEGRECCWNKLFLRPNHVRNFLL